MKSRRRRLLRFSAALGGSSTELHLTVECATNRVIGCVRACFFCLSRCWDTNCLRNHQTASLDQRNDRNKRDIRRKKNAHATRVMCPAAENLPHLMSLASQQVIAGSPLAHPLMCALYPHTIPSRCRGFVPLISHVSHFPFPAFAKHIVKPTSGMELAKVQHRPLTDRCDVYEVQECLNTICAKPDLCS